MNHKNMAKEIKKSNTAKMAANKKASSSKVPQTSKVMKTKMKQEIKKQTTKKITKQTVVKSKSTSKTNVPSRASWKAKPSTSPSSSPSTSKAKPQTKSTAVKNKKTSASSNAQEKTKGFSVKKEIKTETSPKLRNGTVASTPKLSASKAKAKKLDKTKPKQSRERVLSPVTRSTLGARLETGTTMNSNKAKSSKVPKQSSKKVSSADSPKKKIALKKKKATSKSKQPQRGPRLASLNAQAKVKALADNEGRPGLASAGGDNRATLNGHDSRLKHVSSKASTSKSGPSKPRSKKQAKSSSSSKKKPMQASKTKKQAETPKTKKKKHKVQRRREFLDESVEIIDTRRVKRMASLNASAIMTATLTPEPSRALVVRAPSRLVQSSSQITSATTNGDNITDTIDQVVRQWSSTVEEHIQQASEHEPRSVKTVKTTVKQVKMRNTHHTVVETISTYEQQHHNIHIPLHNADASRAAGTSVEAGQSVFGNRKSNKTKQNVDHQSGCTLAEGNSISSTPSSAFTICSSPNSFIPSSNSINSSSSSNSFSRHSCHGCSHANGDHNHNHCHKHKTSGKTATSKSRSSSIIRKYEVKTIETIQGSGNATQASTSASVAPSMAPPAPPGAYFLPFPMAAQPGPSPSTPIYYPNFFSFLPMIASPQQAALTTGSPFMAPAAATAPPTASPVMNYINFPQFVQPQPQSQPSQQAQAQQPQNGLVPLFNLSQQFHPNLGFMPNFQSQPQYRPAGPFFSYANGGLAQPQQQPAQAFYPHTFAPQVNFVPAAASASVSHYPQPTMSASHIHRPVPCHPQPSTLVANPTVYAAQPNQVLTSVNSAMAPTAPSILSANGFYQPGHTPLQARSLYSNSASLSTPAPILIAPRPQANDAFIVATPAQRKQPKEKTPVNARPPRISVPSIITPTCCSSSSPSSCSSANLANRNIDANQVKQHARLFMPTTTTTATTMDKQARSSDIHDNILPNHHLLNGHVNGDNHCFHTTNDTRSTKTPQTKKMKAMTTMAAKQGHNDVDQLSVITSPTTTNQHENNVAGLHPNYNNLMSPSMNTRSSWAANRAANKVADHHNESIKVVVVDGGGDGFNGDRTKTGLGSNKLRNSNNNLGTLALIIDESATTSGDDDDHHHGHHHKSSKTSKSLGSNNPCRLLNNKHNRTVDGEEETMTGAHVVSPHNDRILNSIKKGSKSKISHGWSWKGASFEKLVFINNDEQQYLRKCFPAIKHVQGEVIRVRDCVLLKSGSKDSDLPFVAKITALWESPDNEMMMSLLWYYRPEHTDLSGCNGEVYASRHRDTNSVACIDDKCYVLTFSEFCRFRRLRLRLQAATHQRDRSNHVVPHSGEHENDQRRFPPFNISNELVFYCNKVYDYRQKRILKNPSSKLVNSEVGNDCCI